MGCKNSKPKGEGQDVTTAVVVPLATEGSSTQGLGPSSPLGKKNEPAELFVRSFLGAAENFLRGLNDPDVLRTAQGTVFLNSVAETLRTTFRMKIIPTNELLRRVFDNKMPILSAALANVEDHCSDDGYMRLLNSWELQNPDHKLVVSGKVLQAVLRAVEVHQSNLPEGTFEDVLRRFTEHYMSNDSVRELFAVYSPDGLTIPPSEFLNFLRAAQGQENASERLANEKIRSRFGGIVTKYNFNTYSGGLINNSALDPQRASNVWQDMTQPLPHYLVSTAHVDSEAELIKAMRENVRTLVLTCTKKDDGELYSGSCKLSLILETVKQSGFKDTGYPIILCFNPAHTLDMDTQEAIAALIKSKIPSLLARGIMFEGAMLNDPNFSPAALQRKVLLMGNQAPLRPFVGFHVADMNREGLGVRVTDVQGCTPASKAGIVKDDWLTHLNGAQIKNKQHLREQLASFQLGDEFTMKKENLDEVRIVVGGAVSSGDANAAQSLSDLIFLKFVAPGEEVCRPAHHFFPWEASTTTSEKLNASATPTKRELSDHFCFVSQPPPTCDQSAGDFVGNATSRGAQFVDAGGRADTHIWARGLFTDNAHCGYLLKRSENSTVSSVVAKPEDDITLKIIAGPSRAHHIAPQSVSVRIHGAGRFVQQDALTFTFSDSEESTVAVVEMKFAEHGGPTTTFVASFPPRLLRSGYRMLPCVESSEELLPSPTTQAVFCCISTAPPNTPMEV